MEAQNRLSRVKRAAEEDLLRLPGVTGVDTGCKYVGGERTDERVIRVFVAEKREVPDQERIPRQIRGVKTDVIQCRFNLFPLRIKADNLAARVDKETYDPLVGGISIGPCRAVNGYLTAGTLGGIVLDNATGAPMLLSNFHVMAVDKSAKEGDAIAQPSLVDGGGCPADAVAGLARAMVGNKVDCAVASLTRRDNSCAVVDIGPIKGTAKAAVGMAVRKRGRTSGLTAGTVDAVDLSVKIDYGDDLGVITLRNQIGIQSAAANPEGFGIAGDSGSLVLNGANAAVGLFFAGNEDGSYCVANPIQAVLSALKVKMCAGGHAMAESVQGDKAYAWRLGDGEA